MLPRLRHARLSALIAAAGVVLAPAAALATPSFTAMGMVSLGGDHTYDQFTVAAGATVMVPPYVAGSTSSTGWLRIKANTITIDAGGTIDADGAGYPGQAGSYGLCSLMSMTSCAGAGSMLGFPGGGGGYFAPGADGTLEMTAGTCTDSNGSPGGLMFFTTMPNKVDLGSAGGASNLGPGMTTATQGGPGGGGIELSAAVVVINGTLSARGGDGNAFGGGAPGGGSGGTIEITAAKLTGAGTLTVAGGKGAHGAGIVGMFPPNNGGGGSGGVILLQLPSGASTSTFTLQAAGGATGDCTTGGAMAGMTVSAPLTSSCVDVDGDGYPSVQCGGKDCDDSDPAVHPGAKEICNGKDDNCNGKIDEAPNDCTAQGLVCIDATCTAPPVDGGTDAGGEGGIPDQIDLTGGCTMPDGLPAQGGAALAMGLGAMALVASRRRRRR
jgi:MYXO-CTERM domain-containing protein